MINWDTINSSNFEKFTFHALSVLGFNNRVWYGKGGGDQGRDIVATRYEELPFNLGYNRKWIFQCKRWKSMPSSNILLTEISTASQHNIDFWVLVIPVQPTSSQLDFLRNIEKNYPFKIIVLDLASIEELLYHYPHLKEVLKKGTLPEGGTINV